MKTGQVIILGALLIGSIALVRKMNEKSRAASLEDGNSDMCGGCANFGGSSAVACKSPTNPQGQSCQEVCESLNGTYDSGVGQYGGCIGASGTAPPLGTATRTKSRGGFASANGWG